jgi:hypothetical protein
MSIYPSRNLPRLGLCGTGVSINGHFVGRVPLAVHRVVQLHLKFDRLGAL